MREENTTTYHCTPEELLRLAKVLLVYNVDLNKDYGPEEDTAIIRYGDISLTLAIIGEKLSSKLPRDEQIAQVSDSIDEAIESLPNEVHRKLLNCQYIFGMSLAETCRQLGKNRLDSQAKTAVSRFSEIYKSRYGSILKDDIALDIISCMDIHQDPKHQKELRSILRGYVQHKKELLGSIREELLNAATQVKEELGLTDLNTKITKDEVSQKWRIKARNMNYAPPSTDKNGKILRYYRVRSDEINDAVGYLLIDKDTGKVLKRSDTPNFVITSATTPNVIIRPNYIDSQGLIYTITNAAKNLGIKTPLLSEGSELQEKITLLCLFISAFEYLKEADEVMNTNHYERIKKDLTSPASSHRLNLSEDYMLLSVLIYGPCFHRYSPFSFPVQGRK